MEVKLSERQKRFVDYYLQSGNAKQAAKKAGYSPKTATAIEAENLTKPQIKAGVLSKKNSLRKSQRVFILQRYPSSKSRQ